MSETVVEQLAAAVAALAAVDLDTLDDTALHELTIATQRLLDRHEVAAARVLARWDRCQVWRDNGSLSARQRLANDTGCALGDEHLLCGGVLVGGA